VSSSSQRIFTLAHHEYRAAVRSRILIALIGILVAVTVASVYIASVEYRSQLADYEAYRIAATASGLTRVAPSPLALLSLLRGAMEYIEIIGAIVAIALGYLSVSRERANRTLPLIRSRPVTSGEMAAGSLLGALALIATLILVTAVAAVLCLGLVGNNWPTGGEIVKLLLAYLASLLYMGVFYCLGVVCTARSRVAVNGLMVALGIWLIVVLIVPQIGDTLDADNQVPGGLFSALTLNKPQELKVLSHFGTYERIRTGIEETSFAKHFERFTFAMTDVKVKDRGLSLWELIQAKKNDIAWTAFYVLLLVTALFRTFRRTSMISQGGKS
jgi:ABC-type transport system involved in multi-copper enzyme maturation permease subunit